MHKHDTHGMSRRTFVTSAAVGATAIGLGLAGCGDKASNKPATTAAAGATDEEGFIVKAIKTDGVSSDNDLVIAIEGHMSVLHPMNWSDGNDGNIVSAVYDSLLKLDDNLAPVPSLATSWDVSSDALTYTFHLRDGVKFTDGSTLTAQLVVDNYEYTTNKANGFRRRRTFVATAKDGTENWRIKDVKAADDKTVVFTLARPWSPFLNRMSQFEIIGAEGIKSPSTDYNKTSYGSGPFMLKEWANADHTTLTRNPDYWGDKKPSVDTVTFREMPEAGSRIAALQTGEIDFMYPTPSDQISTIKNAGDINMKGQKSTIMRYVTLNTNLDIFKEEKVRQAMNYAIDKNAFVQVLYAGYGEVATSCIPAAIEGYKEQKVYDFDLDKAKSLMKEAGYENGFEATLWCDSSTQEQKGGTFIMQQLEKIGIKVNVQPMEAATVADKTAMPEDKTEVQMWYVNWSQNDADGYMRSLLATASVPPTSYNTAFWKDDEFDKELDAGNNGATEEERSEHYGKAQDIAWKACPWLFLASDNLLYSYKSYVSGIRMSPDSTIDITEAALKH